MSSNFSFANRPLEVFTSVRNQWTVVVHLYTTHNNMPCTILGRNSTRVSCMFAVVCNTRALPAFPLFGGTSLAHTRTHTHARTHTNTHMHTHTRARSIPRALFNFVVVPSSAYLGPASTTRTLALFLIDPPRPAAAHSYYYFPAHNNEQIFFLPLILQCFFFFFHFRASQRFRVLVQCTYNIYNIYYAPRGPESFISFNEPRACIGLI